MLNLRRITPRFLLSAGTALVALSVAAATATFTDTVDGTRIFNVGASDLTGGNLGGIAGCTMAQGAHVFQTRAVTANYTGTHSLEVTAYSNTANVAFTDSFLAVYQGSFDPNQPTANLVGCNDDGGGGGNPQSPKFNVNFNSGQTYVLVLTLYNSNSNIGAPIPQGTATYLVDSGTGNPAVTVGSAGSGGAAAVPTLSEWAIVLFAGLLAGAGLVKQRRHRA